MLPETPSVAHISAVISQSTAPAFVLGAVAGFLSILMSRMERVADRARALRATNPRVVPADVDLGRLVARRLELLYGAIYFAILTALTTAALLLLAFGAALLEVRHEHGVAALFSVALILLMASLVHFVLEIRMAMKTMHLD
jgi:Protein of unknown function (DUF2721)